MLIFDMDGTLIDSNGIWRDVDIAFLEKRGLRLPAQDQCMLSHDISACSAT